MGYLQKIFLSAILISIAVPSYSDTVEGGEFTVMTYNIAGLPTWINKMDTNRFYPMGKALNPFDVVLVQEDFWYHNELLTHIDFPYKSTPRVNSWLEWVYLRLVNDGLNRFSKVPMTPVFRQPWEICHDYYRDGSNGSDCFAMKGFTFATHAFTADDGTVAEVDIYNLHMESAKTEQGRKIRDTQVSMLFEGINTLSKGQPVIVVGDFNFSMRNDPKLYERFQTEMSLTDSFTTLKRSAPGAIDRIFYRSSDTFTLTPLETLKPDFRDENGKQLSDHRPEVIRFKWFYQN